MNGGIPGEREFMSTRKGAKTPNPFSSSRGGREDEKSFWGAGKNESSISPTPVHSSPILAQGRSRVFSIQPARAKRINESSHTKKTS